MSMHTNEDSEHPGVRPAGSPGDEGDAAADGTPISAERPDDTAADVAASTSAGTMLARARDRCSLSVGEVANHLKLSMRQVEALEADAFDRLPSPMFIRGFARSYARLVQLDPAPVMLALDQHLPAQVAIEVPQAGMRVGAMRQPPPSRIPLQSGDQPSRRLHSVAGLLAAVVVGFLAFEWFGPVLIPGTPATAVREGLVPPVTQSEPGTLQPTLPIGASPGDAPADSTPAITPPEPEGIAAPGASPSAGPQVPIGASSSVTSEIGSAFGSGPRAVRLSFDRESWVEIRDGRGRVIFNQLNPPGSSQVVEGDPPLSLVVGNARSVRLAYGGRDIDLAPHTRVDVARFTLD